MGRVIYMTNIGTIPEEHQIIIKVGTETVGRIEEAFLEKLKKIYLKLLFLLKEQRNYINYTCLKKQRRLGLVKI